ncbi:MAG: acyltransferase family protein, partial [Hyphomonadaceae bacterium]|nr:acyltransferase family protein [Hyphomonadaceae bacterium]
MTAAVLCFVFAVWPLIAFLGGSALSPLVGVAALVTSPKSAPQFRFQFYMAAFAAFLVFAAVSALWSPRPFALIDFGTLSVRSEVLRWGLLMIAGGALIGAAQGLSGHGARWVSGFSTVAIVLQFIIVFALSIFEREVIEFFYPGRPTDDGVQNITRNAMFMAVSAPFLILALVENRRLNSGLLIAGAVIVGSIVVFILRDLDAGYVALAATGGCYVVLRVFGRYGFRLLGGAAAFLVLAAPLIFHLISAGATVDTATTSSQYRQIIWQRVLDFIWEKPLLGSGVGALRATRETIPSGVFEGDLYIPNHPHNMLLQLWAETGAVGASLVALTVLLAAWRLPRPERLGPATPRVAAIIGGLSASLVSFDLWNEAWWAFFCLLAVVTVAYFRRYAAAAVITESAADPELRGMYGASGSTRPEKLVAGNQSPLLPEVAAQSAQIIVADTSVQSRSNNNFNLLRLLFALMVVAFHVVVAVPEWSSRIYTQMSRLAEVGVQGFFVLSGYLVYASLERSKSIAEYAEKRFRRLYPAYAFVILACAGAALIASAAAREDLLGVARYTGWNLIFANFMEPSLPGVFVNNPTSEVNG